MNAIEKQEISKLDYKYRPLGAWAYFGYSLLFMLPIIGLICLIIFACNSGNINRRSFARSYFCGFLIMLIVVVIPMIILISFGLITLPPLGLM